MTSEEVQKSLLLSINNLKENKNKIRTLLTEELTSIDSSTLHFIGKLLKHNSNFERAFYRLLGRSFIQAETHAGGTAILALSFIVDFLKTLLINFSDTSINVTALINEYEQLMENLKEDIKSSCVASSYQDIENLVFSICGNDNLLAKVILNTIALAGLEGKIYIENGKHFNYVIERKTGYNFKVKPFKFFLNNAGVWENQNVKVFLVDGVIEKVSEIDQLLIKALDTKQPAVFIARGFSEEVIATLKVNFDKKNMNVIPVRVESDLESINILNDIASVCGTDILSSLKGEMICFVKWEDLQTVQKVRCLSNLLTIEESKTRSKVSSQLTYLVNKRIDNQNIEDIVHLIDERIKSLTSESVIIRLPEMTEMENQAVRIKIDTCLRNVKSLLNNGTVSPKEIYEKFKKRNLNSFLAKAIENGLRGIKEMNLDKVSTLSFLLALELCGKQALMIFSSKGAILEE